VPAIEVIDVASAPPSAPAPAIVIGSPWLKPAADATVSVWLPLAISPVVAACGSSRPASPLVGMNVEVSRVEWRVKPADTAGTIAVALVVDGQVTKLGEIEGTPETCAMRRAEATATELLCGSDGDFSAELVEHELVVRDATREVARIPVGPSVALTVAPYEIPTK